MLQYPKSNLIFWEDTTMQSLSERTAGFTDSVIRRMTRISSRYGAVNLSQGFPDFDPPRAILDRLAEVSREDFHQYSITWGAQNLREALAEKQSRYMGLDLDPNGEITVTCGSTEAMMAAMMTVADPGDRVVVFSPFYENYGADTILCGAEPIYVPLTPPDFRFNPEVLEDAFRLRPKALVLCNPSNPCGRGFTREELEAIAALAEKYDAYVITDEVYEHIVYAPHRHVYFAALPGMRQRTISCSSLSKTYSITGWRLGYTIAPNLLHHPLAAGLHHRPAGDHGPDQKGPRLPHRGGGGPPPGGGDPRAEIRTGLLRRPPGRVHPQAGPVSQGPGRPQADTYHAGGGLLRPAGHLGVRL